jgi:hypothetical protein
MFKSRPPTDRGTTSRRLRLDQGYRTTTTSPDDLIGAATLAEARAAARHTRSVRGETALRYVTIYDVTFTGHVTRQTSPRSRSSGMS